MIIISYALFVSQDKEYYFIHYLTDKFDSFVVFFIITTTTNN